MRTGAKVVMMYSGRLDRLSIAPFLVTLLLWDMARIEGRCYLSPGTSCGEVRASVRVPKVLGSRVNCPLIGGSFKRI